MRFASLCLLPLRFCSYTFCVSDSFFLGFGFETPTDTATTSTAFFSFLFFLFSSLFSSSLAFLSFFFFLWDAQRRSLARRAEPPCRRRAWPFFSEMISRRSLRVVVLCVCLCGPLPSMGCSGEPAGPFRTLSVPYLCMARTHTATAAATK